jgi:chromosome segregation ATPase
MLENERAARAASETDLSAARARTTELEGDVTEAATMRAALDQAMARVNEKDTETVALQARITNMDAVIANQIASQMEAARILEEERATAAAVATERDALATRLTDVAAQLAAVTRRVNDAETTATASDGLVIELRATIAGLEAQLRALREPPTPMVPEVTPPTVGSSPPFTGVALPLQPVVETIAEVGGTP